jgi:CBS domain containing-hemolysin-like protein
MGDISGNGKLGHVNGNGVPLRSAWNWLRGLFGSKNAESLRETIEEIIGAAQEIDDQTEGPVVISGDERVMLGNILKLRHLTAYDVMVPRADIVSVELGMPIDDLIEKMIRAGHSRLPVYRETLDEVIGIVHIKDLLEYVKRARPFDLADIVRRVLVVAPSMRVLDLLFEMRLSRVHMAMVVDEFGGIDGLITIEDLVEEIVGEIEDEHDVSEVPKLEMTPDGTMIADARATIEDFEALVGPVLSEEEREEDIDTLGGLLFSLAGRVPSRGELVEHSDSGISFEVLEADPRRVKRLRLRNLPKRIDEPEEDG